VRFFLPWWLRNNVDDDKRNKNGDGEGGDDKSKRNEKFSDEIKSDDNIVSDG